ncbi:MAG: hypothetical protein ACRDSN_06280 [Pseudonocardiaceae bacterium]
MFAVDQSQEGSATQVDALDGSKGHVISDAAIDVPAPEPRVERAREARHTGIREAIDDANDILVTPFTGLINSSNVWVERMVPAGLALLLYGFGGMLLANAVPKRRRRHDDWREVPRARPQR